MLCICLVHSYNAGIGQDIPVLPEAAVGCDVFLQQQKPLHFAWALMSQFQVTPGNAGQWLVLVLSFEPRRFSRYLFHRSQKFLRGSPACRHRMKSECSTRREAFIFGLLFTIQLQCWYVFKPAMLLTGSRGDLPAAPAQEAQSANRIFDKCSHAGCKNLDCCK